MDIPLFKFREAEAVHALALALEGTLRKAPRALLQGSLLPISFMAEVGRVRETTDRLSAAIEGLGKLVHAAIPGDDATQAQLACGNGDWKGAGDEAQEPTEIPDLLQRLTPGGEVPAGECPRCGALAYLQKGEGLIVCIELRGGLVQDVFCAPSVAQGIAWANRKVAAEPLDVDDDFLIHRQTPASAPLAERVWSAAPWDALGEAR